MSAAGYLRSSHMCLSPHGVLQGSDVLLMTDEDERDDSCIPLTSVMPLSHTTVTVAADDTVAAEVQEVIEWSRKWPQPAQKSLEWQNQRAMYCTASQHASALGLCQYKSRRECLRNYAGVVKSTFTGNAATRHGEKYEDEAIAKYCALRGVKVFHFGMLPFFENSDWLGGSPDGISADGFLIEVKCPWKRKPNGTVPGHYAPQIQSMMHGLRLTKCHFIEYVPGSQWIDDVFDIIEVPRSASYWETSLPALQIFWDEVGVLRKTVTSDITSPDAPKKRRQKKRPLSPPVDDEPCRILHHASAVTSSSDSGLYTAATLPMPFMAMFCTQGLGGNAGPLAVPPART